MIVWNLLVFLKNKKMKNQALNKSQQEKLTSSIVLDQLKSGNQRYINGSLSEALLSDFREQTVSGQFPKAIILSCIDSRVPVEMVFDQSVGDIFVARVAGNFVNTDILGSMEYACAVAGSPLIVVLGHEGCGAVKAACDNVELGNITAMLKPIKPAVEEVKKTVLEPFNSSNTSFVDSVIAKNVKLTIDRILAESPILKDLYEKGNIDVCGAVYKLKSGAVEWL